MKSCGGRTAPGNSTSRGGIEGRWPVVSIRWRRVPADRARGRRSCFRFLITAAAHHFLSFRPACFRMLLRRPGARSSEGLPANCLRSRFGGLNCLWPPRLATGEPTAFFDHRYRFSNLSSDVMREGNNRHRDSPLCMSCLKTFLNKF
jgi:hypothetical protein